MTKENPTLSILSPASALVELNLLRAWWILIVSTCCTVLFTIGGDITGTGKDFALVQIADYTGSTLSILLFCLARWGRCPDGLRRLLPFGYALFFVLIDDAYYFSAWPVAGDNVGYAFGVLTPAALLYLRPRFFTPFLVVNHLVVCGLILQQPAKFDSTVSAIYGTTIVVVIAVISSIIHYRSKVAELEKTALIARRNQELAASNSSLLAMSRKMDEMMAMAAHDLRSPLLSMAGLCELELSRPELRGKEEGRIFEAIQEGSERMVALVNGMVAEYSARHSSIEGLVLETCDLGLSLREAEGLARPLARRKRIELAPADFPGTAMVLANSEALERILSNLISNAIKYSPEGARVELGLERQGEWWVCEVRDDGPGVPVAERASLFNKLQRGTNLPTFGEESSGLGLYSAKKLVESMKGTIEFEPGERRGSVFRFRLKGV